MHGHIVGPAWLHARDGRRIDELAPGTDVDAFMQAGADASTRGLRDSGEHKLKAGDSAGAIADFTAAITANPTGLPLYRLRGDAERAAGDDDAALRDYCASAEISLPEIAREGRAPDFVRDILLERGRSRLAKKDAAGAASDFNFYIRIATTRARDLMFSGKGSEAVAELTPLIAAFPTPELVSVRADAERAQGDLASAEADYSRVIELAAPDQANPAGSPAALAADCRYKRGHVRRWQGNLAGALEDFRAVRHAPDPGHYLAKSVIWLFLAQAANDRASAARELEAADKSGWSKTEALAAARFLGKISGDEMVAKIGTFRNEERFISSFYSALGHRLDGDEPGAILRFRRALAARPQPNMFEVETEDARWEVVEAGAALP